MKQVKIFDTTLRDGEQSPGCSMNLQEKLEVARALEKLKVDVIEAGFAISSPGDFESVKSIADTVRDCSVASLARLNIKDIDAAYEAVRGSADPRIHVFIATSPLHMEYKLRMTEEQWDSVINANLKSAFNYIHACLPIMMRQKGGSIINMASVVGVHGNAGQANYAASKAGMIALAQSVAKEMGPKGIRLNTIAPGFVETAMTASLPEEIREEWKKKIPLRRAGQPEDIANTALFLASDLSSYISGQVIQVDGGMNM